MIELVGYMKERLGRETVEKHLLGPNMVAGEENILTALIDFLIFEFNLGSWTLAYKPKI